MLSGGRFVVRGAGGPLGGVTVAGQDLTRELLLRNGSSVPLAAEHAKFAYGIVETAEGVENPIEEIMRRPRLLAVMSLSDRLTWGALVVFVLCLGFLLPNEAAEIAPAPCPQVSSTASPLPAIFQQRAHPAYQVFAAQTHLPDITVLDQKTLNIGGHFKLDFANASALSVEQEAALETLLAIPGKTSTALVRNLSGNIELSGEQLALQFRRAVVDYKYLSVKWGKYRPAAGGEAIKAEALKRLQVGDLEKAWQMFIALPKPKPPTGLTIRPIAPK